MLDVSLEELAVFPEETPEVDSLCVSDAAVADSVLCTAPAGSVFCFVFEFDKANAVKIAIAATTQNTASVLSFLAF